MVHSQFSINKDQMLILTNLQSKIIIFEQKARFQIILVNSKIQSNMNPLLVLFLKNRTILLKKLIVQLGNQTVFCKIIRI